MGKLFLKVKVCFLIYLALTLMCSTAEREYFTQQGNLTWDQARQHCQVCFKDLVTLTPENIQAVARNLTSVYWIGLRKNFNSTSNSSISWSRWANGDPLTFQNWYPGWPVFKSSVPKRDSCCSCSCTCPQRPTPTSFSFTKVTRFTNPTRFTDFTNATGSTNVTDFTDDTDLTNISDATGATGATDVTDATNAISFTDQEVTDGWRRTSESARPTMASLPIEAECVRKPMVLPDVHDDTNDNYIEDSCVAMLSFGTWVEKNCTDLLNFICYEDPFSGRANLIMVNTTNAVISWMAGPGDISHYHLQVEGDKTLSEDLTNLTYALEDLTPGTRYSVKVFPVKCGRNLRMQDVTFYTKPNKVENFKVTEVTEVSVSLSWDKPVGKVDFYLIKVAGRQFLSETNNTKIDNLKPGSLHTFTIYSGVQNNSTQSEASNVAAYTKPRKVSNLMSSNETTNSLVLTWKPPEGTISGYRVKAMDKLSSVLYDRKTKKENFHRVEGLPSGAKLNLSVTALVNDTLEGEEETIVSYTQPTPISKLTLVTTYDTLNATWTAPASDSTFTVKLQLDGKVEKISENLLEHTKFFDKLNTAANYTVIVSVTNKHNKSSPPVARSKFTLPRPPTNVKAVHRTKHNIAFEWDAPANAGKVSYTAKISSSFWGRSWSVLVSTTKHIFTGLVSGTTYSFEVRTLVDGNLTSAPATASHCTEPEKREVSLSMLCSSNTPLRCDNQTTREEVFNQLHEHFEKLLKDEIYWKLEDYKE